MIQFLVKNASFLTENFYMSIVETKKTVYNIIV